MIVITIMWTFFIWITSVQTGDLGAPHHQRRTRAKSPTTSIEDPKCSRGRQSTNARIDRARPEALPSSSGKGIIDYKESRMVFNQALTANVSKPTQSRGQQKRTLLSCFKTFFKLFSQFIIFYWSERLNLYCSNILFFF